MLVMIAGIFGLIGYIVWDRKTALRPVEPRLIRQQPSTRGSWIRLSRGICSSR
jgi:hypothetical protein